MIHVTVELWPRGDKSRARKLCEMNIINDATGTNELGNYRVSASIPGRRKQTVVGRVRKFERLRDNVWVLVRRALNGVVKRCAEREMAADLEEHFARLDEVVRAIQEKQK